MGVDIKKYKQCWSNKLVTSHTREKKSRPASIVLNLVPGNEQTKKISVVILLQIIFGAARSALMRDPADDDKEGKQNINFQKVGA